VHKRVKSSRPFSASASSSASCNAGLLLTKVVLMASLGLPVIEIMSFTLRSSLIANCCLHYNILLKLNFEWCIDTVSLLCSDCHTGRDLPIDKFYVGMQAFIYEAIDCLPCSVSVWKPSLACSWVWLNHNWKSVHALRISVQDEVASKRCAISYWWIIVTVADCEILFSRVEVENRQFRLLCSDPTGGAPSNIKT